MDIESSVILNMMKFAIVAVALLMAYAEIRQAIKIKGCGYAWVKWWLGVMGIYWAAYYTRSLFGVDLGMTHQVWVRSPILLTLSLVAAGAIMSLRRNK